MKIQQNEYRTETYDEQYGTVRGTPFGYYFFSYGQPRAGMKLQKEWGRS